MTENWNQSNLIFLCEADKVVFPSADAYERFSVCIELVNSVVTWHTDAEILKTTPAPSFHYRPGKDSELRVLVLGYVNREKGADILNAVASKLSGSGVKFHLLGYGYRPFSRHVHCHGLYELEEVAEKLGRIKPHVIWFPAQWPETYSYTLSLALKHGLAIVAPDIGAFAERTAGREYTIIKPWNSSLGEWVDFWRALAKFGWPEEGRSPSAVPNLDRAFYSSDYLNGVVETSGIVELEPRDVARWLDDDSNRELAGKEKVLKLLWSMRDHPFLRPVVGLIPFRLQRLIKRRLSKKAIHDVFR